jgi:peptide/nickel transport system substrate-binding protein
LSEEENHVLTRVGRRIVAIGAMLSLCVLFVTVGGSSGASAAASGGSMTAVVVNTEWPNLDPALDNQEAADINLMNAVYGELFTQNPSAGCAGGCKDPGQIVPDLAKGYTVSPNGLLVTIELRPGLTFQDGTPFNAQAVQFNIERDLSKQSICLCKTNFTDVTSITTKGNDDVEMHLSSRYVPLIASFIAAGPNWIMSPTAFRKMGATAFGQHPVGAGPYEVVSNSPSAQLTLKRFPGYWQEGHPVLSSLKFENVANDQSAYSALRAGTVQVVVGINTPQIVAEAKTSYQVTVVPSIVVSTVELNTKTAPFNNLQAREAIAYATDPGPIIDKLVPGLAVAVQDEVGPGSSFYEKTVPGYPAFNLAKAKALVKQLGGLSFTFITLNDPFDSSVAEALQSEWEQAGIHMTINATLLTTEVADFESGSWQALPGAAGGPDPDAGVQAITSRFGSNGTFTCCHFGALDTLINASVTTANTAARAKVFDQIFHYIATNALSVPLYAESYAVLSNHDVSGLTANVGGSSMGVAVPWENIS